MDCFNMVSDNYNIGNSKLLVVSILKQAIHDFLTYDIITNEYKNAKKWLFDDCIVEYPKFCFIDICDYLNLNINRLRYEINCLFDRKNFIDIKRNRYRYLCKSDFEDLLDKSKIEKEIIWM